MKLFSLKIILILLFSIKTFATGQVPDYLIIDKDTLMIHSNPLESYFKKYPIPNNLITSRSSGNWRGYIAYFKFKDNNLVVENIYKKEFDKKLNGVYKINLVSIYKDIFAEQIDFPCDFYSGLLICPYGEMLEYVHMGYSSTYEFYKLIEINSGKLIKSKEMAGIEFNNFKKEYYKYFKTTEEYKLEREKFMQMVVETDKTLQNEIEIIEVKENKKNKNTPKENPFLKQKEQEYQRNKMLDIFLFEFMNDYIKTIDIPKTN
jgi:hypothetical protein